MGGRYACAVPSRPADLTSPYRRHRFPPEVIAHAVWLYFRFHLSFRDVRDLLAERGIVLSHVAIPPAEHARRLLGPFSAG